MNGSVLIRRSRPGVRSGTATVRTASRVRPRRRPAPRHGVHGRCRGDHPRRGRRPVLRRRGEGRIAVTVLDGMRRQPGDSSITVREGIPGSCACPPSREASRCTPAQVASTCLMPGP